MRRTRQLDGAHLHFLSGINNPVAAKVGPAARPDDLVALCDILDPEREPGRLTLISAGWGPKGRSSCCRPCSWLSASRATPSCGRATRCTATRSSPRAGRKTRHFDDVLSEISGFFAACRATGTWPGGVHVELTGDSVTECLGGAEEIVEDDLELRYTTTCDPRLNGRQSLDLAFRVAELLRAG